MNFLKTTNFEKERFTKMNNFKKGFFLLVFKINKYLCTTLEIEYFKFNL